MSKKALCYALAVAMVCTSPLAVLARNNDQQPRRMEQQRPQLRQGSAGQAQQRMEAPRQRMEIPRSQPRQEIPRRIEQPRQAPVPQRAPEPYRVPERPSPQVRPEAPRDNPPTHTGDPRGGGNHQPPPSLRPGDNNHQGGDHRFDGNHQPPSQHGQPPRHDGPPTRHYGPPPTHFGERHDGHGYGHHEYRGAHHYHYGHQGPSFGDVLGVLGAMFIVDAVGNMLYGQAAAEYVINQCDEYRYYGYDCEIQRICEPRLFLPPLCKIVVIPVARY